MDNPPHKHPVSKARGFFFECHLGHCGQDFVGETNKFVDSTKASLMEILAFKLDCSLPSAFLYCHLCFLACVLMDFW
jgi:hypothetical protein